MTKKSSMRKPRSLNRILVRKMNPRKGKRKRKENPDLKQSEHEHLLINQKKVGIEPSSSSKPQKNSDSSSSGEEEEAGSDSQPEGAEAGVVPLVAKHADTPQRSGSGKPTPKALEHAPSPKTAGGKRNTEGLDIKGGEKADDGLGKSHAEPEVTKGKKSVTDDLKKQLFQRIWSEDDEIVVLKGMLDYAEKKRSDRVLDLDAFHEFIRHSLHIDVSRSQLQTKIRRLKKKYVNNTSKEVTGTRRIFSKPHDQKAYELSTEIWGKSVVGSPKSNSSMARKSEEDINMVDLANGIAVNEVQNLEIASAYTDSVVQPSFQNMDMEEDWIKSIGRKLYEGDDGMVQGTKEWRQLALEEIVLYHKKVTMMSARTKLVINGLKSRNL